MTAIHLQAVSFAYSTNTPRMLIDHFDVGAGERVFLVGPSGSGKTTLLGLIAGVLTPQAGRVEVLGKDLTRLSLSERDRHRGAEIGYIFQGFNLIPYLSVHDNIALPCLIHSKRKHRMAASTVNEEVLRISRHLDLEDCLTQPVNKLSMGQQQRVAIARAMIGQPRLVIADEPTSSLDYDRQQGFLRLLLDACTESSASLLFVSHDLSLMHHFDRQVSMAEIGKRL